VGINGKYRDLVILEVFFNLASTPSELSERLV